MCKKMCPKIMAKVLTAGFIALALGLAFTISFWSQQPDNETLKKALNVIRFLDIMIPALVVGALIKFIIFGIDSCHQDKDHDSCANQPK